MAYHYSHRRAMARRGITPCHECNGEGFVFRGRSYEYEKPVWCSACDATGWYRDEAHGLRMKRIRQHTERMAA